MAVIFLIKTNNLEDTTIVNNGRSCMKELVVDVTGVEEVILVKYKHDFNKLFYEKEGIFTELEMGGNRYFLLAYNKQLEVKVKSTLLSLVCCVVREQFKSKFIYENLTFRDKNSFKFKLLIKVLSCFDREYDDKKIKENFKLSSCICVFSLVYFRLGFLKEKWKEIVSFTNKNSGCFLFNEPFFEFVRFVISSLEFQEECLSLVEEDGCYCIISGKETIDKINKENKVDLIFRLLVNNPRRINILVKSCDIVEFLNSLFEKRVDIVQN